MDTIAYGDYILDFKAITLFSEHLIECGIVPRLVKKKDDLCLIQIPENQIERFIGVAQSYGLNVPYTNRVIWTPPTNKSYRAWVD